MTTHQNLITAIGVPPSPESFFPNGASLDIGPFGAVVVGLNGSGKTKFLQGIGHEFDLIYRKEDNQGLALLIDQLDYLSSPNSEDEDDPISMTIKTITSPRWNRTSGDGPSPEHIRSFYKNVVLVQRAIARKAGVPDSALNIDPDEGEDVDFDTLLYTPYFGHLFQDVDRVLESEECEDPRELRDHLIVDCTREQLACQAALILASFYASQPDFRDWDFSVIAGLAVSREILRNGLIGLRVSKTESLGLGGPIDGMIRFWFNSNPESTPLIHLTSAPLTETELDALNGWKRRAFSTFDSAELKSDLRLLFRAFFKTPIYGHLEFTTPQLPATGAVDQFPLFRVDDGSKLPFLGLRTTASGTLSHLEVSQFQHDVARSFIWRKSIHFPDRGALWASDEEEQNSFIEMALNAYRTFGDGQGETENPLKPVIGADIPTHKYHHDDWNLARITSHVAGSVFHLLFPDAPIIHLVDRHGQMEWVAIVRSGPINEETGLPSYSRLNLEDLSAAQFRWAKFAIGLTDRWLDRLIVGLEMEEHLDDDLVLWWKETFVSCLDGATRMLPGQVVLIDEPELGLHRQAESRVATMLVLFSKLCGFKPIIATHSPTFIRVFREASANVFWTHRNERNEPCVDSFTATDLNEVQSASGIDSADLLQLVRAFLFVEGEHDKAVIAEIFGDELSQLGVYLIPLRGADGVSQVIDSTVLWQFTEAKIIIALDHIDDNPVNKIWERARDLSFDGRSEDALQEIARIDRLPRNGVREEQAIRDLFTRAVENRGVSRINVVGFSKPDIINYFDPKTIIEFGSRRPLGWQQLVSQWRASQSNNPRGVKFKPWLRNRYPGTLLTAEDLASKASKWQTIPADLSNLLNRIRSIVQG